MLSGLGFGSLCMIIKSNCRLFSIIIVTVVKISGNSCHQSITLASFNADEIPFFLFFPSSTPSVVTCSSRYGEF